MALSSVSEVEQLANEMSVLAEGAVASAFKRIQAKKMTQKEAQEALDLIQRINAIASDLITHAAKSVVANLKVTQAKLVGLVKQAKATLQTIETARKFIDILADVLVFLTAAVSGNPAVIIPAALGLAKDVGLELPIGG